MNIHEINESFKRIEELVTLVHDYENQIEILTTQHEEQAAFVNKLLTFVALADAGLDHNRLDVVRQQIDGMRELLTPVLDRLELEKGQLWWLKQQEVENGSSNRSGD